MRGNGKERFLLMYFTNYFWMYEKINQRYIGNNGYVRATSSKLKKRHSYSLRNHLRIDENQNRQIRLIGPKAFIRTLITQYLLFTKWVDAPAETQYPPKDTTDAMATLEGPKRSDS